MLSLLLLSMLSCNKEEIEYIALNKENLSLQCFDKENKIFISDNVKLMNKLNWHEKGLYWWFWNKEFAKSYWIGNSCIKQINGIDVKTNENCFCYLEGYKILPINKNQKEPFLDTKNRLIFY